MSPKARFRAFPPIDQYAFLADGQTCALVAPDGAVEWMCVPHPDSPSVFGAILDRDAGRFRLGPQRVFVPTGRRYLPGTLILETTWQTRSGWLTVRDALVVVKGHECDAELPFSRAAQEWSGTHVLVRVARCLHGSVQLALECAPAFDYGQDDGRWERVNGAASSARTMNENGSVLRLATSLSLGFDGREAYANRTLEAGEYAYAALCWSDGKAPHGVDGARSQLDATAEYWRGWLNQVELPDHPWRSHLERSAIVLKGLIHAPTGATLAAGTTSLPETPGGGRNWDYRYSWLRDSSFALWALYTLGFTNEADDYLRFVADVSEAGPLQVLYGVRGERELPEVEHDLTGYEGAKPVRTGNDAALQRQLDMWGAVLDAIWIRSKFRPELTLRTWALVKLFVREALDHWREPDQGIWEMRGEPQHFTSSKLMCWVAVDRGARLAALHDDRQRAADWSASADEIRDDICANGIGNGGHFTQAYGSEALDASLLLMPLVRFLPSGDERVTNTVLAVADRLTEGGLVMRYRVEETPDGVGGGEFSFTICSFWLVSALVEIGEGARARRLCERLLSFAGPLGIYAEELDPETGRHWGNIPQAFTHLALINAVTHVIRDDIDAKQRLASLREDART